MSVTKPAVIGRCRMAAADARPTLQAWRVQPPAGAGAVRGGHGADLTQVWGQAQAAQAVDARGGDRRHIPISLGHECDARTSAVDLRCIHCRALP